jgi:hypothetical protein
MGSVLKRQQSYGPAQSSLFLRKILANRDTLPSAWSTETAGLSSTPLVVLGFVSSPPVDLVKMKKNSSKNTSPKADTTATNLESRFESGQNVFDYFDTARAIGTHGGPRSGAGRKSSGKLRKTVKLSPEAIRRYQEYGHRKKLPDFSAALEEASSFLSR